MAGTKQMPSIRVCIMTAEGNGLFTVMVDEDLTVRAVQGSHGQANSCLSFRQNVACLMQVEYDLDLTARAHLPGLRRQSGEDVQEATFLQ